jgi:hypothetical protein
MELGSIQARKERVNVRAKWIIITTSILESI